jgi:N-acetylglucosaminyldiphosphoundecaprenol N-acetyl-beta-D-mannosaminyltransferase
MKKYFNINLEFDHQRLEEIVDQKAKSEKGYCCFVDLTSLVYSYNNLDFREVLNNAIVNSCDGSYIALSASKIHNENLKQYIGPDFFEKFIYKSGTHVILGSTPEVYQKIIERVTLQSVNKERISYLGLPFKKVEEFDYKAISEKINERKPNYIWVSLGAPKQEYFMSNLLPFLDKGMMLGVGAALNYFSGEIREIPEWTKKMKIVWIYRLVTEPRKQAKRLKTIFLTFPKMIKEERRSISSFK